MSCSTRAYSLVKEDVAKSECSYWSISRKDYYRVSSYASAVFGVVMLSVRPSVRPSVCLSVVCTSQLCDKTKQCTADILIPHERAIALVFWHQQWLVDDDSFVWNLRSRWPTPLRNTPTLTDFSTVRAIDGVRTLPPSPQRMTQKAI